MAVPLPGTEGVAEGNAFVGDADGLGEVVPGCQVGGEIAVVGMAAGTQVRAGQVTSHLDGPVAGRR